MASHVSEYHVKHIFQQHHSFLCVKLFNVEQKGRSTDVEFVNFVISHWSVTAAASV